VPDKEELKQVEEYRVVVEVDGEDISTPPHLEKAGAERLATHRRKSGEEKVRVQSRTVTTTPWKDVPSE
jgi:hypothetical protein